MNVNGKTQSMIAVRLAETLKYGFRKPKGFSKNFKPIGLNGKNSSLANILKER